MRDLSIAASQPRPAVLARLLPGGALLGALEAALLAVLLALAGLGITGYRFGDSNHSISVPILKHLMDPRLYPGDIVVATSPRFSTVTYQVLALALPGRDAIPVAFFALHLLTLALILGAAYRIGRWLTGPATGALAALASVPVHLGLAGSALYRPAFTHSSIGAALGLWALAAFLEGRRVLPLLLLSLGAYNHLLYSGYLLVPLTIIVLWEWRHRGTMPTLAALAAAVVPLVPLAAWHLSHRTPLTAEWLELLRLRSEHHSLPSAFGGSVTEASLLLALAALTLSRLPEARQRLLVLLIAGIGVQFVLGTVFSEVFPVKAVLQYQPHRSWTFLGALLRSLVAAGVVAGFGAGGAARIAAVLAAGAAFVPGLAPLLGTAVVAAAGWSRPEPRPWARVLALAAVVSLSAWTPRAPEFAFLRELPEALSTRVVVESAALALLLLRARDARVPLRASAVAGVALALVLWVVPGAYRASRLRWEWGPWIDVQRWVRQNTPTSAVVLTPPQQTGFRVFSERTIVGEWKDGTQQYFDAGFAAEWDRRMQALDPERYHRMPPAELREVARRYGAEYIVTRAEPARPSFELLYRNDEYAVYRGVPFGTP